MGAMSPGWWVHGGRVFSVEDIAGIRQTVAWLPRLGRRELAATMPIHGPLAALGPVRLVPVRADAAAVAQWNAAVARWHPLGCVLLAGAARALAVRERWIGWEPQARRANRVRVINNSRFLIFPHVQVPHLASHVLGQLARRVRGDWLEHWVFAPLLLETFVDPRHDPGTLANRGADNRLPGAHDARARTRPTTLPAPAKPSAATPGQGKPTPQRPTPAPNGADAAHCQPAAGLCFRAALR